MEKIVNDREKAGVIFVERTAQGRLRLNRGSEVTEHKLTERLQAHHEAGQAVVARVLGISLNYATIFPMPEGNREAAQTESAAWVARAAPLDAYLEAIANDAKACLAGPIAQERYRPRENKKIPAAWADGMHRVQQMVVRSTLIKSGAIERDVTDIYVSLDQAAIDAANHLMDELKGDASALVAQYWPAIQRVAEALLTSRILYQEHVDLLMRPGRHAEAPGA